MVGCPGDPAETEDGYNTCKRAGLRCVVRLITCYNSAVIRSYSHRGLRRAHQTGSYHQVNAAYANRIARVIATRQAATKPSDLDLPGYRLHPLKGHLEGFWSIRISANWRITFRMEGVHAYDVDLTDYH